LDTFAWGRSFKKSEILSGQGFILRASAAMATGTGSSSLVAAGIPENPFHSLPEGKPSGPYRESVFFTEGLNTPFRNFFQII
jgi:hypothetical protein